MAGRFTRSQIFGAVLALVAALAIVMSVRQSIQSSTYNQCQSAVAEQLIQVQTSRAEAAEQDRASDREESAATAELIQSVFTSTDRGKTLAAYEAYAARMREIATRRAQTDETRKAHPLPAPPSKTCG